VVAVFRREAGAAAQAGSSFWVEIACPTIRRTRER
jgi:hypothetical protein